MWIAPVIWNLFIVAEGAIGVEVDTVLFVTFGALPHVDFICVGHFVGCERS